MVKIEWIGRWVECWYNKLRRVWTRFDMPFIWLTKWPHRYGIELETIEFRFCSPSFGFYIYIPFDDCELRGILIWFVSVLCWTIGLLYRMTVIRLARSCFYHLSWPYTFYFLENSNFFHRIFRKCWAHRSAARFSFVKWYRFIVRRW